MNLEWFPGPPPAKPGTYLRLNSLGRPEIHVITDHRKEFPDMQIGITWGNATQHYKEIKSTLAKFYWLGPIKLKTKSDVDRLLISL